MTTIGVGIIGGGRQYWTISELVRDLMTSVSGIFAREEHLVCSTLRSRCSGLIQKPAVKASDHLTLKAIYSRSLKSAQSVSNDTSSIDLYSDDSASGKGYADLLARPDIQAVIIAHAHFL